MIFLWILLVLVLLILIIRFLRVNLIIDYHDRSKIYIRILFFEFNASILSKTLLRTPKSNDKLASKRIRRELKTTQQKASLSDIVEFAEFLIHLAKVNLETLRDFLSKAKVDLRELNVSVGCDDAADTAIQCCAITQAVNGFCALLQHFSTFRCRNENLYISPNFTSTETKFSVHVVVSCTLVHVIGVYLRANMRFFD